MSVDLARDADYVIARVVEHGALADVKWVVRRYGLARIHAFFRDAAHPEISGRTRRFWRAFFDADEETWSEPPSFRRASGALWQG